VIKNTADKIQKNKLENKKGISSTRSVEISSSIIKQRNYSSTLKVTIDFENRIPFKTILREISPMMEQASIGMFIEWIFVQSHLHPKFEEHIKNNLSNYCEHKYAITLNKISNAVGSKKRKIDSKPGDSLLEGENHSIPFQTTCVTKIIIYNWIKILSKSKTRNGPIAALIRYTVHHWSAIKKFIHYNPIFTDPNEDLWLRWHETHK
jgi:hypothetical protein